MSIFVFPFRRPQESYLLIARGCTSGVTLASEGRFMDYRKGHPMTLAISDGRYPGTYARVLGISIYPIRPNKLI